MTCPSGCVSPGLTLLLLALALAVGLAAGVGLAIVRATGWVRGRQEKPPKRRAEPTYCDGVISLDPEVARQRAIEAGEADRKFWEKWADTTRRWRAGK